MPANRKPIHQYPTSKGVEETEAASFEIEIPFDGQIVKGEVRPLPKDKGYFTVRMDTVFTAHIHKIDQDWYDFLGNKPVVYQCIGTRIDEYLKNLTF